MFEVPATLKGDIESVGHWRMHPDPILHVHHIFIIDHIVDACEQATASRRAEGMAARTGGTRDSPDDDDACRVKASQRGLRADAPAARKGRRDLQFCGLRFLVWDRQVVPVSREGVRLP